MANDLVPRFADGVWLVQLAPLVDSAMVPRAVATALRVRGRAGQPNIEAVVAAVGSRDLLLVFDNCEHLIAACAHVSETLLRACPHLRILATSRAPLRVSGEVVYRVAPMALPGPEATARH
ncbi:MAG: hypothetical protein M3069_19490 [Chloroflexota bacterium]|nr:hypothetical protein [Chloroflexota bacterium]